MDDYLRTSAPHVYAAGDVTGRTMLVQSASYDARIATENAVMEADKPYVRRIAPHGGFTDPEYGSVGLTEEQARADGECVWATVPYAELDRAVIDGLREGLCKLIVSRETHRILGAHVVGEQAVEIVSIHCGGEHGGRHSRGSACRGGTGLSNLHRDRGAGGPAAGSRAGRGSPGEGVERTGQTARCRVGANGLSWGSADRLPHLTPHRSH